MTDSTLAHLLGDLSGLPHSIESCDHSEVEGLRAAQVRAWLAEDVPSFDYGGAIVGEDEKTATLFAKANVRPSGSCSSTNPRNLSFTLAAILTCCNDDDEIAGRCGRPAVL